MPLNRPECRPQKFVMVTQVAAGRLVPPFNPRASRCHPPIHPGESVPPPNPPASRCHPPIHQPACQDGATRQFVSGRVRREVQTSATPQPETVPPVSSERREERKASPRWCHPPVQRAGWCRAGWCPPPTWCHPPTRNGQLVPPPSSEVQAWCHPPIRGAEVASSIRASPPSAGLVGASPQSARLPEWCHSSIRSAANLVPPPNSEWPTGATPQSGGRKWRRRSGPLRPELLPFARSDRFQFVTQRRGLCSLVTLNEKLLA
jgi:hypothetical protein